MDGLTQNRCREGHCSASYKEKISRLNETSRKSVSIKFVSMAIETPSDLNGAIISFFNLFTFGPLA